MLKSILITGANTGLGKEAARQLALLDSTQKIYLACRNQDKAQSAKRSLEIESGKNIFEIIPMDLMDLDSVRRAVDLIPEPVEGLIMNAGGNGGTTPGEKTADGVTQMFATNLLGHVVLVDALLKAKKLNKVAVFAGSEAARGVKKMGMKRPDLQNSSVDEFKSIADGSFFGDKFNSNQGYVLVKYMGALWASAMARKNTGVKFITISPGGTSGTDVMNNMPLVARLLVKHVAHKVMPFFGLMHPLDVGAQRYLDGLHNPVYKDGVFYGSKEPIITGPLIDQANIFSDLADKSIQDKADKAFIVLSNIQIKRWLSMVKKIAPVIAILNT